LGKNTNVYLASAKLAAVSAKLGKLPTVMENVGAIAPLAENIYRYLNFHEIATYKAVANKVIPIAEVTA